MKKNEEKSDESSKELIDWAHVGVGVFETLEKSERLFTDAKFLYDDGKFSSAIPLFINSIEESLKAHELAVKFRKYQTVSQQEWNKLMDHKHKLLYIKEFIIKNLEKMDQNTSNEISEEIVSNEKNIDLNMMTNFMKNQATEDSQLQNLKEKCTYTDWDTENNAWDNFDRLDKSKQEDLAFYIMKKAELESTQLRLGIEQSVNCLRRDGNMVKDLPFPKYNEFREPKNYESFQIKKELSRGEKIKFDRGAKIMQKFVIRKSFGMVYQEIPSEQMVKYLKLIQHQPDDEWYPHPIIRATMMAFTSIQQKNTDGNHMGMSGDAEETQSGEPMMTTIVIISKEKEKIIPRKIAVITDKSDEFEFSDKIIEKILDTEMIIERFPGKTIPLEVAHQAFSEIGIKIRKIKDNEIESAITLSKKMLDENKIMDLPSELIPKMKEATKENWEELDPLVRSAISMSLSTTLPLEDNQIIMSGYVDPIPKFKVRGMIFQILKRPEFIENF